MAKPRFLGFVLIAAVVLGAYSFMLRAPFRSMDDAPTIVDNPIIRDVTNIPKVLTGSFFGDHSYYRPLVTMSFMAEYHAFGLDPFWFNLDNVILHILNSFLVFVLIRRLWSDRTTAFWAGLLFAIHPIQWEAVSNISGRAILLNAFFVFSAFYFFLEFYQRWRMSLLLGSVLCFVLALLCKESAAILPVVLILYMTFFPKEERKPWFAVAPFFLGLFGFIIFRHQLGINQLFGWGSWDALVLGFLSFARGVITYLRLFIFPVDLYFDRSRMVFGDFFDPQLTITIFFWLTAFFLLWKYRRAINGRRMFLVFWFLVELAPVSQIVTSLGVQPGFISLAEHFLYVPSAAMFTALVLGGRHLWDWNQKKKMCSPAIAAAGLGGFLVFLFLTTIQQTVYASNELSMLKRSVLMQPYNSRVQYSLGMNYVNRGMFQTAENYFRQATAIDPWNIRAQIALGKALCDQGRYEDGIAVYRSIRDAGSFESILRENLRLSIKLLDDHKKP
jgi:hypothetical protein